MGRVFVNFEKKLTPGVILTLSWDYIQISGERYRTIDHLVVKKGPFMS